MTRNKIRTALSGALVAMTAALAMPSLAQSTMTDAEVRKVDKESKKITLKHGEIKNLDMPPMTMVFNVSDPSMLDKVQAGDKIRFSATNDGGKFTVTEIQPVK
ncbi:copper-binding protein [Ramlibacter sp. PS3R-8]|uniref:copper-binding protein n=1 Tax=Ramlibacter sp. PS3R-8 TaxID=3133437 RepID=UPI00403FAB22